MTSTLRQRLRGQVWTGACAPEWNELVGASAHDDVMKAAVTDRFHAKQGRSTGRWILQNDNRMLAVYLKRHYALSFWDGVLATFWPQAAASPAMQEHAHLHWAMANGFRVPRPVAVGQAVGPRFRLQSYLAVEELAGMLPLHEAIPLAAKRLAEATFARWKRGLISEMASIIRRLHGLRRFHRDLYLCHFYIPRALTAELPDWRGHVNLIDLHRLIEKQFAWRFGQMKDLAQLLYSSDVEGVTPRDRAYFWKCYLGGKGESAGDRIVRWCVGLKEQRYHRHHIRRKARAAA